MRRSVNKQPLIMDLNPHSSIAEAYRVLRTNLEFAAPDARLQTIVITSAMHGEGKTTTIANLAVAFAHIGKKVLLIDADLRKPSLHDVFVKHNRGGLTNIIAGQYELGQMIQETHIEDLSLLPSGPLPPNASELLASQRFMELLKEAKSKYDMILIDTPPALTVTDAQIISSRCDGVLLVANVGKVKRQAVVQVKTLLDLVKANFLGVVLNQAKRRKDSKESKLYYQGGAQVSATK
ncbi:CpsD/CapB family tyrosine-protein kinase [Paenibacillus sp. TRM 82003]|nr:CpsD/CapB family tyrosine-protein kinase [Paenibacillus sp. TRM 82003]